MGFLLAESYTVTLISGAFKASVGLMLLQKSVKCAEWPEKMWHLITSRDEKRKLLSLFAIYVIAYG